MAANTCKRTTSRECGSADSDWREEGTSPHTTPVQNRTACTVGRMASANIPRQNEAEDDPSLPLLVSKKSEYVKEKSDFLPSEEVQENFPERGEKKVKNLQLSSTFLRLFHYSTVLDWVLMLIGAIAAIAGGLAMPFAMLLFGDVVTAFTFNALTNNVSMQLFNETVACDNMTLALRVENLSTKENAVGCVDNRILIHLINYAVYKFIGIALGAFLMSYIQVSFYQTACERQLYKIRLLYYKAILRQDIGWFDANPTGELASRINDDLDKIHDGIGDKVSLLIQWIATLFGGLVIAFASSWKVSLLVLAFVPILAICGSGSAKEMATKLTSQAQKQYVSASGVAEEVLSSIRTVVALGGEEREFERYNRRLREAGKIGVKKGIINGFALALTFFFIYSVYATVFWFGGYLISVKQLNSGSLLTAFFALIIGAFSLGQAAPHLQSLMTAAGASVSIFDTINRVPSIDSSSEEGEVLESFDSTVEFRNVQFSYSTRPDVMVLRGFNLKVPVGKTVALVGSSGCGKSTVVQLLQRFYDPTGGGETWLFLLFQVYVGGKDIRTLNIKWLRSHVGVVSQEPVLFDTTIAENIRFGKEDATMDDIHNAARKANAHDFIAQLPDGYNTLVGERGVQLSGGQKQRVAIARALVRDPNLLLFDEATSALDTESESIVQEALEKARLGRTTIIIAHRLSTIQNADMIVVIEEGKVVEMGTHTELTQCKGPYFNLVAAQTVEDIDIVKVSCVFSLSRQLGSPLEAKQLTNRHGSGSKDDTVLLLKDQKSLSGKYMEAEQKKLQELWDKETPVVPLLQILKKNSPEWWMIALGLVGCMGAGAVMPAISIFFGKLLAVFANPPEMVLSRVHPWAGLFLVLAFVTGTANFLKVVFFTVSGERLTARLRSESFHAMLKQEIGWFDNERNSTGALVTRLSNDAAQVEGATGTPLGTLLETFFGLVLSLTIAFVYSWILTVVLLGFMPVLMAVEMVTTKVVTAHATGYKIALEKAGKLAVDSIEKIRTVATLGVERMFFDQYKVESKKPYIKSRKNAIVNGLTYGLSQGTLFFGYAVAFRFGAHLVTLPCDHLLYSTFNDFFVVFLAVIYGALAAGQAGSFAPSYTNARLSANRIFALLNRIPATNNYCSEDGHKPDRITGAINVENVFFNYPTRPDVKVLNGLSCSVNAGQTLALVGQSGCGKSTVVSLLERFYEPSSGCLKLDQQDIRQLNIRWLRQNIGIVSQEPVLFDMSIADNIRYGANFRDVSDVEVMEAAKAANIHSFIETLPQGYNTNVGAKGTQLSGGQKQRIAIARALVRDPKILLLDEATSALDTESEKVVQEALNKAREGRTSIVIAHRLSTIQNADVIAVIKDGQVVESGTHKGLMGRRGLYYKLNRYQVSVNEAEATEE
ncbi:hypothetical protein EMCRGX_G017341 [Ephydatia muelleri]